MCTLLVTLKWNLCDGMCSMGGSVAVHVAAKKVLPSLAGLIVVDVVEVSFYWVASRVLFRDYSVCYSLLTDDNKLQFQGTAMASLMHMQKILSNRMQYFPTIEKAVIVDYDLNWSLIQFTYQKFLNQMLLYPRGFVNFLIGFPVSLSTTCIS